MEAPLYQSSSTNDATPETTLLEDGKLALFAVWPGLRCRLGREDAGLHTADRKAALSDSRKPAAGNLRIWENV